MELLSILAGGYDPHVDLVLQAGTTSEVGGSKHRGKGPTQIFEDYP